MEYDVIFRNGNIYGGGMYLQKNVDMAIKDGEIVKIDKHIEGTAPTELDIRGKMVSAAFVDSVYCVIEEAERIIRMCLAKGTTTIKYHMPFDETWEETALEKAVALKEKYKDKVTLLCVVPYTSDNARKWEEAAKKGWVDFIGTRPNEKDTKVLDTIFQLAQTYDLPIDITVDNADEPDIETFLYVIEKTVEERLQGRVTCNHVTALDAEGMDPITAGIAVAKCARARVNVVSMTSEDIFTSNWERRGATKVRDLLDAGVSVSIASGNIQNEIRPFGNGNPLEEALLTAQVHKFTTHAEFSKVYEMLTYNPAENTLLEKYGTNIGYRADLIVVDAPNTTEAILDKADINYVFKCGKMVAKDGAIL